ncbi:MAG: hypothetical protein J6Q93_05105, partial [Prevotella sp.]|nr:hypothetical protein [Prevotella sp.]
LILIEILGAYRISPYFINTKIIEAFGFIRQKHIVLPNKATRAIVPKSIPSFGTNNTMAWHEQYQSVEATVPSLGTTTTMAWY